MFDGCKLLQSIFDCSEIYKTNSLSSLANIPKIHIQSIQGLNTSIYFFINDTILDIKNRIREKEGIPPELQMLFLKNKQLEDNKSLNYYKINKNATLHLVIKNN
jgi:hypothetical protein